MSLRLLKKKQKNKIGLDFWTKRVLYWEKRGRLILVFPSAWLGMQVGSSVQFTLIYGEIVKYHCKYRCEVEIPPFKMIGCKYSLLINSPLFDITGPT